MLCHPPDNKINITILLFAIRRSAYMLMLLPSAVLRRRVDGQSRFSSTRRSCLVSSLFLQLLDRLLRSEDVRSEAEKLVLELGTNDLRADIGQ